MMPMQDRLDVRDRISDRIKHGWGSSLDINDGWLPLVDELDRALAKIDPGYTIAQVKEKFGGLRYYTTSRGTPEFDSLIEQAERDSYSICDWCSGPGKPTSRNGWTVTRCEQDLDK